MKFAPVFIGSAAALSYRSELASLALNDDPCACIGKKTKFGNGDVCDKHGATEYWCLVGDKCDRAEKWEEAGEKVFYALCGVSAPADTPEPEPVPASAGTCAPKWEWKCWSKFTFVTG